MAEAPRYEIAIVKYRLDRWLAILSIVASFATAIKSQWKQKYFDNQIEVYRAASNSAARIASLKKAGAPSDEIQKAYIEFTSYYWGPMSIFEDGHVEKAMIKFKKGVDDKKSPEILEQLSLKLAHIFRNATFDYYFPAEEDPIIKGTNKQLLDQMNELLLKKEKAQH